MLQVYNGRKLCFVHGLVFLHLLVSFHGFHLPKPARTDPLGKHLKLVHNTNEHIVCVHNVANDELCSLFLC